MPGRRAILPSAMFACVVIAALSAQAIRTTYAADECLAKPNGPTPQGQHWYYRIDHANNNRQCWRLAPEGLPVQKAAPQSEEATASEPDPPQQPRAPQTVTAAPARAASDAAPAGLTNSVATALPAPWPDPSKLPALLPIPQSPVQTQATPQTASADGAVPTAASDKTPAVTNDPSTTGSVRNERSQRAAAEKPLPSAATQQQLNGIDHTFALLMVMFALLGVTGPILHFTHRQRQREVINYKPPRWAPVVPLNTPAPRVRVTHAPDPEIPLRPARRTALPADQTARRPAPGVNRSPIPAWSRKADPRPAPNPVPLPDHPPDPNERLRHALQQLVDRIQTIQTPVPRVAPRPTQRADIEMMKSAR